MTTQKELEWMSTARSYIGTQEIKGLKTSPVISKWLHKLKAWWKDDETPWCGVFIAHCLSENNLKIPKYWMRAKDYLSMPNTIDKPSYGCIVIFQRDGGGHVGFVVGQNDNGDLMVLGGNQGNEVNIRAFSQSRVLGYRWPGNSLLGQKYILPIISDNNGLSTNEA